MVRERTRQQAVQQLALVCLAQFMVVLDVSIVNVALPSIRDDLHFSQAGLQWVVNGYTLAFAGFLLLGGRAADLYGRRRVFLLGMGLFTAASLAGGLAQSQGMLIAARTAQGLGGAILSPATLTILTTTFTDGRSRSRALGMWTRWPAPGAPPARCWAACSPTSPAGTAMATGSLLWLSRIAAEGTYPGTLLGPALLGPLGLGLAFTPIAFAATAGVPAHQAGLASGRAMLGSWRAGTTRSEV